MRQIFGEQETGERLDDLMGHYQRSSEALQQGVDISNSRHRKELFYPLQNAIHTTALDFLGAYGGSENFADLAHDVCAVEGLSTLLALASDHLTKKTELPQALSPRVLEARSATIKEIFSSILTLESDSPYIMSYVNQFGDYDSPFGGSVQQAPASGLQKARRLGGLAVAVPLEDVYSFGQQIPLPIVALDEAKFRIRFERPAADERNERITSLRLITGREVDIFLRERLESAFNESGELESEDRVRSVARLAYECAPHVDITTIASGLPVRPDLLMWRETDYYEQ